MNGAITEPCAVTKTMANATSSIAKGINHFFLFLKENLIISIMVFRDFISFNTDP